MSTSPPGETRLSFTQEGFWEMAQMVPEEPLRNVSGIWRLRGPLQIDGLRWVFAELVRRHETLRSTFRPAERGARPVIHEEVDFDLVVEDLRGRGADAERDAMARCQALRGLAFDIGRRPPALARLFRLEGETWLLFMAIDHIIFDGWSFGVVVDEITRLYAAFVTGRHSPLRDLPVQFFRYSARQRSRLTPDRLEALWAYWEPKLRGNRPEIPVPTDRPRPQPYRHGTLSFDVPRHLTEGIRAFSRRNRVTPFMTTLAGLCGLFSRMSGEVDLSVVAPVSNRGPVESRGLIGPVLNLVIFRTDLSGDPSFRKTVVAARRNTLEAFAHQEMPFEVVLERLGQTAAYSTIFAFENYPLSPLRLHGVDVEEISGDGGGSFNDHTVVLFDTDPSYKGYVAYNRSLFDEATVRRTAESLLEYLSFGIRHPEARWSDFPPPGDGRAEGAA